MLLFFSENNMDSTFRPVINFISHIIVVIILAWFIVYGYGNGLVNVGQSMEPTINAEETVLIDRVRYRFSRPSRYDIICFRLREPETVYENEISIKRIVGLPGETVQIVDGDIYINNQKLEPDMDLPETALPGIASDPVLLGENEYFVLGDNRPASEDSRYEKIGNIPLQDITGRVWLRIRPISEIGFIR